MDRGPGQGHKGQGCCSRGPFPEQGQSRASVSLTPSPGPAPNLERLPLPFPTHHQGRPGEERKKPAGERLYNGSQPACHIAQPMRCTRSQRARAGSWGPPAPYHHTEGDGEPAPASCPSPPHPVPGTGLSRDSTSPVPIPQHKASHTFWLGSVSCPGSCFHEQGLSVFILNLKSLSCMDMWQKEERLKSDTKS